MKRTLIMLAALMFGATAITASAATTTDDLPGLAPQPASYFYTGKPYDADLGAYVFTFRNYDPELNRWTTPDPSGFPDGANNRLYAPIPTTQYDLLGLAKPGASTLWNNYPDYSSFDATMTYELVGGWLLEKHLAGDDDYQQSCALRLSIALNWSDGHEIPQGTNGAQLCGDYRYILGAASMGTYLTSTWGSSESYSDLTTIQNQLTQIESSTSAMAIAVIVNQHHVSVITKSYSDPYVSILQNGDAMWILE